MICHNLLDSVIVAPTLPPVTLKWGCVLFWPYLWRLRFVFHLISLCNRILFFLWFFFFFNFHHLQMQKSLLAQTSYKSRRWAGLDPWGGVGWLLRKERMVGWSGFHTCLAGDVFWNGTHHQWRYPALVKKRRARRLLLSLFLPLSLLLPTPEATSGYGNQVALEIQRLDFSQSSTLSTTQVMGAHYVD